MLSPKKCLTGVVATSLLLVVTVISVISFQTWFGYFSTNIFSDAELGSDFSSLDGIETVVGDEIYIKALKNLSIKKVTVDGNDCNISINLTSGINSFGLGDCLNSSSTNTPEVVIITDESILTKKVFLDDLEVEPSSQVLGPPPPINTPFITTWNTSVTGSRADTLTNQIALPLEPTGNYNFNVSWGDGTSDIITSYNQAEIVHNYSIPGVYNVTIFGTLEGFNFYYSSIQDEDKILDVLQWGDMRLGNSGRYFYSCTKLNITAVDAPDLSQTTSFNNIFYMPGVGNRFNSNINHWDVSNIENFDSVFGNCANFNQPLNSWDVSSATSMNSMFNNAESFNQNLSNWNISRVTSMSQMFRDAESFNQNLSNWNTSSVENMYWMFHSALNFAGDVSNWDVGKVTNMRSMFDGASNFNSNISNWNVSRVEDMRNMFRFGSSFNQDLSNWDVDQATSCSGFADFSSLVAPNFPNFTSCTP